MNMHAEEQDMKKIDSSLLTRLSSMPDCAVLTETELAELTSLSPDTLRRLNKQKLGPPRTWLSERRFGYTVGKFRAWLDQRTDDDAA
jgi:hypothetical protein